MCLSETNGPVVMVSEKRLPMWRWVHRGLIWENMPGSDNETKKLGFVLFVRGLYDPDLEAVSDEESGLDEEGLRSANRDTLGRVLVKAGRVSYGQVTRLTPRGAETLAKARAAEKEADEEGRKVRQAALLARFQVARKSGQRGLFNAFRALDITAHSAVFRALGKGRGSKRVLRGVSLDRIERAFELLKKEGFVI